MNVDKIVPLILFVGTQSTDLTKDLTKRAIENKVAMVLDR